MNTGAPQLKAFLAEVSRRAFRMARLGAGSEAEAMDLVQEALCRFVEKYAARPEDQWRPLFWRILVNAVRDFRRRRAFRSRFLAWLPGQGAETAEAGSDPLENVADQDAADPEQDLAVRQELVLVGRALAGLPDRQREAFLLRVREDLSVSETAQAMGCSEGAVKTHYFRAVQALRRQLKEGAQ